MEEIIFQKLHNHQVNLIKQPNRSTITAYNEQLKSLLANTSLTSAGHLFAKTTNSIHFTEFLIFPILTSLKKLDNHPSSNWSDLNELLVNTSCLILDNTPSIHNPILFDDILNTASMLLSKVLKKPDPNLSISDELLSASLLLIQTLFQHVSHQLIARFYRFRSLPSIGLLITVSIDIILNSKSLQLRLDAFQTLKTLSHFDNKIPEANVSDLIGTIFASFLPGISIKIIQGFLLAENFKTLNHKLICASLSFLTHVIMNVFDDRLLDNDHAKMCLDKCKNLEEGQDAPADLKSLIVDRVNQPDWAEISGAKLMLLLERLIDSLIIHENSNVALALVSMCSKLSDKCYFTMNEHIGVFLRVLVTFAAAKDDNEQLVAESVEGLKTIEGKELNDKKMPGSSRYTFLLQNKSSTVNKCMEELLLKLPRLMTTPALAQDQQNQQLDELSRLANLKTLYGYLRLAGDHSDNKNSFSPSCLMSFFHLNMQNVSRLLEALLTCIQFDYKSLNNLYEMTPSTSEATKADEELNTLSNYSGLETYLADRTLLAQLSLICEYLSRSDAIQLIVDELLTNENIYLQHKQYRCEVMFLINLLLKGLANNTKIESLSIISTVLSNFLNESFDLKESRHPSHSSSDTNNNTLSTKNRNRLILNTCLTLEVISTSSQCLQSDDFNPFLIDTLYFCLENHLSPVLLIRVVSQNCLKQLATNLHYSSIQSLLSSNFDYVMNDLILKSYHQLSTNNHNKDTTESSYVIVLCSLLDISNADLVPYLERLIDDYFLLIELHSEELEKIIGICQIMLHMARAMHKWYPVELNYITETSCGDKGVLIVDLKKLTDAKKKPDSVRSFTDTLTELNTSRFRFDRQNLCDEPGSNENEEEEMIESMERIADEDKERTKEPELHIRLQKKCMELCVHLVSHPFKQVRLYVIDLIGELSRNLISNNNEFLPLVNNIWLPICQRFSLDDFIVKSKIIYLMFNLSLFCADFISSRFSKDFLPRLKNFMKEQAKQSLRTHANLTDTTYIYSHAFKLQCAILANIDQMCVLFETRELDLENVIEACILVYLDKRQPKKLQYLAVQGLTNCSLIDSDLVWLCLHYILPFDKIECLKGMQYSKEIQLKYAIGMSDETRDGLVQLFKQLDSY